MEPKRHIDGVYTGQPKPISAGRIAPVRSSQSSRRLFSKRPTFLLLSAVVVIGLIIGLHNIVGGTTSLVPKDVQNSVDFSVYYPDIKKLPAGYSLDTKSFRLAQSGVVLFAITYGGNKNIAFSEEQQPSRNDIDKFISTYIPVNTTERLTSGRVKIGAYGSAPNIRTVASLPIQNGPWLIITAPADINHADLIKVLQALGKH